MALLLTEQIHKSTSALGEDDITCKEFNWPPQLHLSHTHTHTHTHTYIPVSPTNLFRWYSEMDGREAWHIISLLGVWGNRISFLSQIKMMRHAGMNNFMAIDIHTLTNKKKSYGRVGNGFISEKKNRMRCLFQLFEKWHLVLCQSDSWCCIKTYNEWLKVIQTLTFNPFSKQFILLRVVSSRMLHHHWWSRPCITQINTYNSI